MGIIQLFIFPILVFALSVHTLTPDETCELCQLVVRTVNGHFSTNISSRRKLANQLKHECNRHFNYRRRCLSMIKENGQLLYQEMNTPAFKPMTICLLVKECTPYVDPTVTMIETGNKDTEN